MLREALESDDVAFANEFLDTTLNRVQRFIAPLHAGHVEMTKSLITLASASLIFSISVVQFLGPHLANPKASVLLPFSWCLFGLTVVAGAISHQGSGMVQAMIGNGEVMRAHLLSFVRRLEASPDASDQFLDKFEELWNTAIADWEKVSKMAGIVTGVMFYSYVAGLVCLLVFGIRNLPF
jgi:hypothetical protein